MLYKTKVLKKEIFLMQGIEGLGHSGSNIQRRRTTSFDGARSSNSPLSHRTSGPHRAFQVTPSESTESTDYPQIFLSTMADRFTSDPQVPEHYMSPQVRKNYMISISKLGISIANREEIACHDMEAYHEAFQESERIQEEIESVYGSRARDNAVFFANGVARHIISERQKEVDGRIISERQKEMEPQAGCGDILPRWAKRGIKRLFAQTSRQRPEPSIPRNIGARSEFRSSSEPYIPSPDST